jgi:hypothetical protein
MADGSNIHVCGWSSGQSRESADGRTISDDADGLHILAADINTGERYS